MYFSITYKNTYGVKILDVRSDRVPNNEALNNMAVTITVL